MDQRCQHFPGLLVVCVPGVRPPEALVPRDERVHGGGEPSPQSRDWLAIAITIAAIAIGGRDRRATT
jgi:hypothetical protein